MNRKFTKNYEAPTSAILAAITVLWLIEVGLNNLNHIDLLIISLNSLTISLSVVNHFLEAVYAGISIQELQ